MAHSQSPVPFTPTDSATNKTQGYYDLEAQCIFDSDNPCASRSSPQQIHHRAGTSTTTSTTPILPVINGNYAGANELRQFGNPATLGLSAFATTTLVLSIFNTGIPAAEAEPVVLGLGLFYGGFVQMVAGVWEFIVNNTFGGTAFLSYGAFWMSLAYFVNFVKPDMAAEHVHEALGVFLLSWTVFTAVMVVGALKTNKGLLVVFVLLELTFILLTAGHFAHEDGVIHAGGWAGILTAVAAYYVGAADLYKATWKIDLLPIGPISKDN
jgi:succinate-acetate transporter protein